MTEFKVARPQLPISVSQTGSTICRIFIGSQGLRAGWGTMGFAILLIVLSAATYGLVRVLPLPSFESGGSVEMTPFNKGVVDAVLLMIVWVATSVMAAVEHRRLAYYGFGAKDAVKKFFLGAGWGFFFISLLVVALFALHHLTFERDAVSLGTTVRYGVEWFITMFFVGAFEETLFRGYLQWTLGRGLTFMVASLLLAILFGAVHGSNPGESYVGLVSAGIFGLVFSLSIWYTRSLWWAIGFHTSWNWGMTFFYGTPNSGLLAEGHFLAVKPNGTSLMSGGSVGPEGSIILLPLLLLVSIVVYATCRADRSLRGSVTRTDRAQ